MSQKSYEDYIFQIVYSNNVPISFGDLCIALEHATGEKEIPQSKVDAYLEHMEKQGKVTLKRLWETDIVEIKPVLRYIK